MEIITKFKEKLIESGHKISTAESCTSGLLSSILTSMPGSSDYFEGGLIVYSNKAKINVLGIEEELINTYTEVSSQVACRMADRVKEIMGTEYSIAITGYTDPDGFGTKENPAGTIYLATSTPTKTTCQRLELGGARNRNAYLASIAAIEMMAESIKTPQAL